MRDPIDEIIEKVAERVTPSQAERKGVHRLLTKFIARAEAASKKRGMRVRVEVEGSVAKDTWISADRDLDVFLIFPPGTKKDLMAKDGLELAKAIGGGKWSLGYAEHPYVEAEIDGFTLDIVPSVEMAEGEKPVTSVDRTPLHTSFVKGRLTEGSKAEVRVLKQFMKGVGVYGAELKVGGFSGYLAELLIINYGSFAGTIRAAASWGERTLFDLVGHHKGQNLGGVFDGNLVVVDPVDMSRNAAAAVSSQSYFTFIAAARQFQKRPGMGIFFPKKARVKPKAVMDLLAKKGSHVLAVAISCPRVPSDILWGEAFRSMRRIASLLESEDFHVIDSGAWSDEKQFLVFVVELCELEISRGRIHQGPMVQLVEEAERFLVKYRPGERVLAGPYVRGDRWVVELLRDENSAARLLSKRLKGIQFSRDIGAQVRKGFKIYADGQLGALMEKRPDLAAFTLQFLRKRPSWLN